MSPTKTKKSGPINQTLKAQIKTNTGTEHEVATSLTSKQLESLLLSYGMKQAEIDTLERKRRIHFIWNLSTQHEAGHFKAVRKEERKKRRQKKRNNAREEARIVDRRAQNKAKRDAEQALHSMRKTKRSVVPTQL